MGTGTLIGAFLPTFRCNPANRFLERAEYDVDHTPARELSVARGRQSRSRRQGASAPPHPCRPPRKPSGWAWRHDPWDSGTPAPCWPPPATSQSPVQQAVCLVPTCHVPVPGCSAQSWFRKHCSTWTVLILEKHTFRDPIRPPTVLTFRDYSQVSYVDAKTQHWNKPRQFPSQSLPTLHSRSTWLNKLAQQ
jgi:hypothetical protein